MSTSYFKIEVTDDDGKKEREIAISPCHYTEFGTNICRMVEGGRTVKVSPKDESYITVDEMRKEFEGLDDTEAVDDELEQARVQLAGCLVAAEGGVTQPAKPGDYGWSVAYQKTLELRKERDDLASKLNGYTFRRYVIKSNSNLYYSAARDGGFGTFGDATLYATKRDAEAVADGKVVHGSCTIEECVLYD